MVYLCTYVSIVTFFQALTFSFMKPDDGSCNNLETEQSCLSQPSDYAIGQSKCVWINTADRYSSDYSSSWRCEFVQPESRIKIVLFVAIFTAVVSTPIAILSNWVIKYILCSPDGSTNRDGAVSPEILSENVHRLSTKMMPSVYSQKPVPLSRNNRMKSNFQSFRSLMAKKRQNAMILSEVKSLSIDIANYRRTLGMTALSEFDRLWKLDCDG
eukprot:gene437-619_t